jgi:hypothetical protein
MGHAAGNTKTEAASTPVEQRCAPVAAGSGALPSGSEAGKGKEGGVPPRTRSRTTDRTTLAYDLTSPPI